VFLQVEDLSGQEDASAKRDRAHPVQRGRQRRNAPGECRTRHVECRDHQEHEREALSWRQLFPVRRDKQEHAAREHQAAERKGDAHEYIGAAARLRLEAPDSFGGGLVDDVRLFPALKPPIEIGDDGHEGGLCNGSRN
jgi:hypothetical protein